MKGWKGAYSQHSVTSTSLKPSTFRSSVYVLAAYRRGVPGSDRDTTVYCVVELGLGKPHEQPTLHRDRINYFQLHDDVRRMTYFSLTPKS